MEVRPARPDDAAAIGEVQVAVWRATYAGLMHAEPLAAMDVERIGGLWRGRLEAPPPGLRVSVALAADELVGFAAAGPSQDDAPVAAQQLYAVNLLPHAHGTGLADLLLRDVLDDGPCSLWVVDGNARAVRFYERRHFAADGATADDERLGVTELRMVRAGRIS